MEVRKRLQQAIEDALSKLGLPKAQVQLDHPKEENHGDYSSNIAMAIFSNSKFKISARDGSASGGQNSKFRTPMELAQEIVKMLNTNLINNTDRVEAVAPGFINFWLSQNYLINQLTLLTKGHPLQGQALLGLALLGKKIMVEFTDPNPFKEFHIGHLYSNTVGESLCRLFEAQGAIVWRANYQGDIGLHVAKAIYGLSLVIPNSVRDLGFKEMLKQVQHDTLQKKVKLLGGAYAAGSKAYEEDEKVKREINELNKKIYDHDPSVWEIYQKGRQWSLDYFETIYQRLGTKFNRYYFESEAGPVGLKLVCDHIKDGVFKESDGAIIFEGKKHARLPDGQGLHNRVFINSLGLPTYEAKDLGLPPTKYKDFAYDQSIIVTGNEIDVYFKVVLKALSMISPELAAKTRHLGHGMVWLTTGKMSSRTGQVLTGEWLLDEVKRRIQDEYQDMDDETAEQVAVGAVKYALLRSSLGQDITFDFDKSITLEGDSGPYIQYTYARTRSVIHKGKGEREKGKLYPLPSTLNPEELALLRAIHRFPEVVGEAAERYAPNLVCSYLFDLAQKFNLFYQKHQIIGVVGEFRLALTAGVGQIFKNGLYLLGIEAPERM